MKLVAFAAFLAVVVSARVSNEISDDNQTQWPWKIDQVYRYEAESYTLARLQEGASSGSAFRAHFILRVASPDRLEAKLVKPEQAKVHQELPDRNQRKLPEDLKYEPVQNLEQPFEIYIRGGRVLSLKVPKALSLAHENLLKGLISTLQVDLSSYHTIHHPKNNYDQQSQQGQFRKMETDVTGDCATLYTVSPAASEWRREINFSLTEEPVVITKSKNYGHCHHRVAYHFGVPESAEWTGTANKPEKEQFIKRATTSRILVGKQGPIFKAETTSTVHVHPYQYGQQKAEVLSYVKLNLVLQEEANEPQWEQPNETRAVQNLLYSMTGKQMQIPDRSTESNEQVQENEIVEPRSRRSIKMPRKIVSINKIIIEKRSDEDASDNSSSGDSSSTYVNDEIPQENEPAYAALYMNPQPHKTMKQNPTNAQKLVQETAQLLQNPNNMPKSDLLSKFNILVRVIASMDSEQLLQTSRSIEATKSSNNVVKADMWKIYRDAVAQAGTMPAFKQIVSWIESKKIQGEEAAEIVGTLPYSLRYPTKQIMKQFFELALSPEVSQQEYLNSTALIAATKFINMGQVDNVTAHSYYPTHMYGRLARQHDSFVLEEVLPRLQKNLEQAIQENDSRKAQVYIKAIGKLGHRSILDVFAPYLEGKIPVSTYLRALIVDSLDVLAYEKDGYVRTVLYSILRNTAEPYEVRLAAIQIIFITHPTSAMMQAMAQMTHDDPSVHVRAALKMGIQSVAQLRNPRYLDLARTAQAALEMVNKDNLGYQYSSKIHNDYFDSDYELGIMSVFSSIGSEDNLFPKFLRYDIGTQTAGWKTIKASFSSVQQFAEKFQQEMNKMWRQGPNPQPEPNHKFSAKKISEMLKIQRGSPNPLEAALYINLLNQQRYFSFDEESLEKVPEVMRELFTNLAKGIDVHYTKVFNQAQISVMFPVASGMPFMYKYKEPTVVHIQAKAKGAAKYEKDEQSANIQGEIHFTYARNIDGSVGFLDTLSNQYASAGAINKVQVNIPVKYELETKNGEVKIHLQNLRPEQDTTIVHYSVWPYTAYQKKDTLTPISLDPTTKAIIRNNKVFAMDSRFGQATGTQYQLQGYSYSWDYSNMGKMFQSPSRDLLSSIILAVYQKDVAQTHFNLRYLGKQSQSKGVTFTAVYDQFYNLNENTQEPLTASMVQDVSPNSSERREQLVRRVASGINSAKAKVIDLSASFDTPQKTAFVLTAAISTSPVDPKIQYAFFASRNSAQGNNQINGVLKVNKPELTTLDAAEALKKDLKISFDADIKFGDNENGNIKIQGQAERTKKYTEALQKSTVAQLCADQMAENNKYLHACHKMTVMAHAPDYLKASVFYKDVSVAVKYAVFQAYRTAEQYGLWNADVNPLKTTPEGKLEIEMQNNYLDNIMNLNLNSRYGEVRIKNVRISKVTPGAVSTYTPFSFLERVANYYSSHLYQPYCSVDDNRIKTFSNRNYKYALSPSWHVVLHDERQRLNQDQLVVLAKRPSQNQQEIYISYQSETGREFEIEIQPSSNKPNVRVNTNSKKVSDGDMTMYWDDVEQQPFLQYYQQNDGVLMLNIREDRFRMMYDGQRLVVLPRNGRNNTRGICGQMTGEPRDDYFTPSGLVDSAEHYAASYTLDQPSDAKTQELKSQARELAYQRQYKYTNILRSDKQWQKQQDEDSTESGSEEWNQKVYRSKAYQHSADQLHRQVQYYVNHDEICITMTPLGACPSQSQGEDYRVQSVQVVCRPKVDQLFQEYVNQIRRGQNPQVSGVPQIKQYRVPTSCRD